MGLVNFHILGFLVIIVNSDIQTIPSEHVLTIENTLQNNLSIEKLHELKCSSYKDQKWLVTFDTQKYENAKLSVADKCLTNEMVVQRYTLFENIFANKNNLINKLEGSIKSIEQEDCGETMFNESPEIQEIIRECKEKTQYLQKLNRLQTTLDSYISLRQQNQQTFATVKSLSSMSLTNAISGITALLLVFEASKKICEQRTHSHTHNDYNRIKTVEEMVKLLDEQLDIINAFTLSAPKICQLFENNIIEDIANEITQLETERFITQQEFSKRFSQAYKNYVLNYEQAFIQMGESLIDSHTRKFFNAKEIFTNRFETQRELLNNSHQDFHRRYEATNSLVVSTSSEIQTQIYNLRKSHKDVDFSEIERKIRDIEQKMHHGNENIVLAKKTQIEQTLNDLKTKISSFEAINHQRSTMYNSFLQRYHNSKGLLIILTTMAADPGTLFDSSMKQAWQSFVESLKINTEGVSILSYKSNHNSCDNSYTEILTNFNELKDLITQFLFEILKFDSELSTEITYLNDSYHDELIEIVNNVSTRKRTVQQTIIDNIKVKNEAAGSVFRHHNAQIKREIEIMKTLVEKCQRFISEKKRSITNALNSYRLTHADKLKTSELSLASGFNKLENELLDMGRKMIEIYNNAGNLETIKNIAQTYCSRPTTWILVENCYRIMNIIEKNLNSIDITIEVSSYSQLIDYLETKMNTIQLSFVNVEVYFTDEISLLSYITGEITKLMVSQKNLGTSLTNFDTHLNQKVDIIQQLTLKPFVTPVNTKSAVTSVDKNLMDRINLIQNIINIKNESINREVANKMQVLTSSVNDKMVQVKQWQDNYLQKLKSFNTKLGDLQLAATRYNSFIPTPIQTGATEYSEKLKNSTIELEFLIHSLDHYKQNYLIYLKENTEANYATIKDISDQLSLLSLHTIDINDDGQSGNNAKINEIHRKATTLWDSINNIDVKIPNYETSIPDIHEFDLSPLNDYDQKLELMERCLYTLKQAQLLVEKETIQQTTPKAVVNTDEDVNSTVELEDSNGPDNINTDDKSTRDYLSILQNNNKKNPHFQEISKTSTVGEAIGEEKEIIVNDQVNLRESDDLQTAKNKFNFDSSSSTNNVKIYGLPILAIGLIIGIVITASLLSKKHSSVQHI